jgi:hypothetical protein
MKNVMLAFLIMTICLPTIAQEKYFKPNVILFMLNKSTNKIEALKKRALFTDIKDVEQIDNDINMSIIKDFSKKFKYCPVYFFYSDQYDLVKAKDWENVTFYDYEHLTSNKKIEIHALGNYYIAEVNYPPVQKYEEVKPSVTMMNGTENGGGENEFANSHDYGIVLYNENFEAVSGKLMFTNISLTKHGSLLKGKNRKYVFKGSEKLRYAFQKNIK